MLDSIYVGLTGLVGYSKSLKVISNNVANLNTPGFKSSQLQFADLFYSDQGANTANADGSARFGTGLNTLQTTFDFKQGEIRQTGNDLDAALDGNGLFVLKSKTGDLRFTRAGEFGFDADGFLVSRATSERVMGLGDDGNLVDISLNGIRVNAPKATAKVSFSGNLSSTADTDEIDSVKVIDALGGQHLLKLVFKNNATAPVTPPDPGAPADPGAPPAPAGTPGEWTVTVSDEKGEIGTGTIQFQNGALVPGKSSFTLTYAPEGTTGTDIAFDFSKDTTSFSSGTQSTLAVGAQDGFAAGALTKVSFDEQGNLVATYSNGQTVKSHRLALALFDRPDATLVGIGGNEFATQGSSPVRFGNPGSDSFGKISSGNVEISNVDLSQEFSELIVTQRGYQASSQIISTASELVQDLLDMRGKR